MFETEFDFDVFPIKGAGTAFVTEFEFNVENQTGEDSLYDCQFGYLNDLAFVPINFPQKMHHADDVL